MKLFIVLIFKHKDCGKYSATKIDIQLNHKTESLAEKLTLLLPKTDKYCYRCLDHKKKPKFLKEKEIEYHPQIKFMDSKTDTLNFLIQENKILQ